MNGNDEWEDSFYGLRFCTVIILQSAALTFTWKQKKVHIFKQGEVFATLN